MPSGALDVLKATESLTDGEKVLTSIKGADRYG
jgi:hypothetical protein